MFQGTNGVSRCGQTQRGERSFKVRSPTSLAAHPCAARDAPPPALSTCISHLCDSDRGDFKLTSGRGGRVCLLLPQTPRLLQTRRVQLATGGVDLGLANGPGARPPQIPRLCCGCRQHRKSRLWPPPRLCCGCHQHGKSRLWPPPRLCCDCHQHGKPLQGSIHQTGAISVPKPQRTARGSS